LALGHHSTDHGVFPAASKPSEIPGAPLFAAAIPFSVHSQILGSLESMPLFHSINFLNVPISTDSWDVASASSAANATARNTMLSIFVCPSDSISLSPGVNYRACVGPNPFDVEADIAPGGGGSFPGLKSLSPNEFRDGLSNVVGFAERSRGSGVGSSSKNRDIHLVESANQIPFPDADKLASLCYSTPNDTIVFMKTGKFWIDSGYEETLYNHVMPPNKDVEDCSYDNFNAGRISGAAVSARSSHSGGVHCLMMDGSVRFVGNTVALNVWRAIASRAGGEVVSSDSY
jgi:prepilin-type processing-associated H-X9-DG protein